MPVRALTVQGVERMKPNPAKRLEVPDAALSGLYFIVQPSGAKSWAVRYRAEGRTRKLTLGGYPVMDLMTARSRARAALLAVTAGRDPGLEKQSAKRNRRSGEDPNLFPLLAEEFLKRHVHAKSGKRWAAETQRIVERELLPVWSDRLVQEITRRSVIELLDGIVDRGSPVMANRTLAVAKKFFAWCLGRSIVEANPCLGVKPPAAEVKRDRVLTDGELRLLWQAAELLGWPFGRITQLLILTGARREEVGAMRWSEINEAKALWSIPGQRTKNKDYHEVPLSPAALALLTRLPRIADSRGYVFSTSGQRPVSGYSKAKRNLDEELRHLKQIWGQESVHVEPWRLHDIRRTVASGMAQRGTDPHVIEAVLNHRSGTISGVAAVYNRYAYLEEKRAALEAWANVVVANARES